MKICRDENDSRGTTLLGRANASRPAWIPLTGDQFGKCTPAVSGLSTPAPRALPAEKFRPKALSAHGAFSLDARKTRFRQDPIQRLSNRIELLDGIIPHIFRLSSGKFRVYKFQQKLIQIQPKDTKTRRKTKRTRTFLLFPFIVKILIVRRAFDFSESAAQFIVFY